MSGTSSVVPIASSTSAGSASVLSPYSASGPSPLDPVAAVSVPPVLPPVVSPPPSSPLHAAATSASNRTTPRILIFSICFPPAPWSGSSPEPSARVRPSRSVAAVRGRPSGAAAAPIDVASRRASPGDARGGLDARAPALAQEVLDRSDDAVARDQHAADDHGAEHHELQRRRQAHHAHHLAQAREEERRRPRRERAREPAGQRRAADHDRGDRSEEVRRTDRDVRRLQERREED